MGLLKTGLKAAVAVKTADVIHERVLARQQEHAAAQGHPSAGGTGDAAWLGRSDRRGTGTGAGCGLRRTWVTSLRSLTSSVSCARRAC